VLLFSQDSQREQRSQARTRVQVQVLLLVRPQVQVLVLVQPQARVLELVRVRAPVWVRKRAVAETAAAGAMGLSPVASSPHSRPRAEPRLTRQPKNAARFVCP
jgi:hypothetical protein